MHFAAGIVCAQLLSWTAISRQLCMTTYFMSLDLTSNGLINRRTYTGPHLSEGTGDFDKKIISDSNFIFPFTWCDWFCVNF